MYRGKDKFLYENNTKPFSRAVDAVELAIEYSFNFKNQLPLFKLYINEKYY
jgi:hypothetical protein